LPFRHKKVLHEGKEKRKIRWFKVTMGGKGIGLEVWLTSRRKKNETNEKKETWKGGEKKKSAIGNNWEGQSVS